MKFEERIELLKAAKCFALADELESGLKRVAIVKKYLDSLDRATSISIGGKSDGYLGDTSCPELFASSIDSLKKLAFIQMDLELVKLEKLATTNHLSED